MTCRARTFITYYRNIIVTTLATTRFGPSFWRRVLMTCQAQTAAGQLLISCTGNVANSRPRRPVQLFKIYHTYICTVYVYIRALALYGSDEPVEKPGYPGNDKFAVPLRYNATRHLMHSNRVGGNTILIATTTTTCRRTVYPRLIYPGLGLKRPKLYAFLSFCI